VCAVRPADEPAIRNEGILAGPLIDDSTGNVVGMLKVEQLGFQDLHFSNLQTFQVLCEWIGRSYGNAMRMETDRNQALINRETQIMTHTFYERQRDFLVRLGQRLGFDITMLIIRLDNADEVGDERAAAVPIMLREVSRGILRTTDLLFEHQASSHQYCVLLPGTPPQSTHTVAEKLLSALRTEAATDLSDARFSITVHGLYNRQAVENIA
jgi:GGDEF domain-containing protein